MRHMSPLRCCLVLTAILLGVAPTDRAWGNPCVLEYVGGRNVLAGAPQRDISIATEQLRIDLVGSRRRVRYSPVYGPARTERNAVFEGDVRISYRFENRGPARQVVVGFPIGLYNDGALYPWKNIVSRFSARGAGTGPLIPAPESGGLTIDRAPLDGCEVQNSRPDGEELGATLSERHPSSPAAPTFVWYAWQQSFQPGMNQVDVSYRVRMVAPDAGDDASFTFSYVLTTTASWGDGKIGRLDISFSGSGLPGRWRVIKGPGRPNVADGATRKRWSLAGHAPAEDLELGFEHVDGGQ